MEETPTNRTTTSSEGAQPDRNDPPQTGQRRKHRVLFIIAFVFGLGLIVLLFMRRHGANAGANAATPPQDVAILTVKKEDIRIWSDFSAHLVAVNRAEIHPEVGGRITEVKFRDGQEVKEGDVLFVIEPAPYEAAVERAKAHIELAEANLKFSTRDQARNAKLLPVRAIAQRQFDEANTAEETSAADLLLARAELKSAEVDLDHAYLKSPISGRISRAELTVGNVVQSGPGAPLLASVVSLNEIYADFDVDEQTYLDTVRVGAYGNKEEQTVPVTLILPGDSGRQYNGFIQNFDNRLDASSGTIRARARFENPDKSLIPGMFVTARLAGSERRSLILIPDRAVGFDQSRRFVFVITPENKVAYREVDLGADLGGRSVVLKGLNEGERVVVDGLQQIRPGAVVIPHEAATATTTNTAAGQPN